MPDTIKNIHLKLANELNLDQTTSNLSWSKYENLSKNCLLEVNINSFIEIIHCPTIIPLYFLNEILVNILGYLHFPLILF